MNAVDTNVLVYAVDLDEPIKSKQAQELLETLGSLDTPFVIPWQVATEFLACLRRWELSGRISREVTHTYLSEFILRLPIIYPTASLLPAALGLSERHCLSHWDSMLIASCVEAGIDTLYSEDFTNGMTYGTVRVLSPFDR